MVVPNLDSILKNASASIEGRDSNTSQVGALLGLSSSKVFPLLLWLFTVCIYVCKVTFVFESKCHIPYYLREKAGLGGW